MNIVTPLYKFNEQYTFFCEPTKNNVMHDGCFIRILYSIPQATLNGIFLSLNFQNFYAEKYYNKCKYNFDIIKNNSLIEKIKYIEDTILKKMYKNHHNSKIPQYKIYEQLKSGTIKIHTEHLNDVNSTFILKIAGIWETPTHYGLTYKFVKV